MLEDRTRCDRAPRALGRMDLFTEAPAHLHLQSTHTRPHQQGYVHHDGALDQLKCQRRGICAGSLILGSSSIAHSDSRSRNPGLLTSSSCSASASAACSSMLSSAILSFSRLTTSFRNRRRVICLHRSSISSLVAAGGSKLDERRASSLRSMFMP